MLQVFARGVEPPPTSSLSDTSGHTHEENIGPDGVPTLSSNSSSNTLSEPDTGTSDRSGQYLIGTPSWNVFNPAHISAPPPYCVIQIFLLFFLSCDFYFYLDFWNCFSFFCMCLWNLCQFHDLFFYCNVK